MLSRREMLTGVAAAGAGLMISSKRANAAPAAKHAERAVVPPDEAIALLRKGNKRYVSMQRLANPGVGPDARRPLTRGQWPYATIVSCSDSRVPPELIFDEGLGRLFIIRVAGNIVTPALLGSIEYATLHSTSRLIMVMGHESCGAVGAAVHAFQHPGTQDTPGIDEIMNRLMPAVLKARKDTGLSGKALVEAAAKENVRMVAAQIAAESERLRGMQSKRELRIVGGYYSLTTGKVDVWV